jgi:hypothetical protein
MNLPIMPALSMVFATHVNAEQSPGHRVAPAAPSTVLASSSAAIDSSDGRVHFSISVSLVKDRRHRELVIVVSATNKSANPVRVLLRTPELRGRTGRMIDGKFHATTGWGIEGSAGLRPPMSCDGADRRTKLLEPGGTTSTERILVDGEYPFVDELRSRAAVQLVVKWWAACVDVEDRIGMTLWWNDSNPVVEVVAPAPPFWPR